MWCVKHFMAKSANIVLASRLYLKNKKISGQPECVLSFLNEVMNQLLETYETDGHCRKGDENVEFQDAVKYDAKSVLQSPVRNRDAIKCTLSKPSNKSS